MLSDPQDRLGCRLQGVSCTRSSAAWFVSPFLGAVRKASERMGFSASSNFFLDAWNYYYWESLGLRNGMMFRSASVVLKMNFLWIHSNPLHLAELQKCKSWNSVGENYSLLFRLGVWLLGLNYPFCPVLRSGSLYPFYRICYIWASSLPFSHSAHGPFLHLLPALNLGIIYDVFRSSVVPRRMQQF